MKDTRAKVYRVTKRVTVEYVYTIEAYSRREARDTAEDIGEVHADDVVTIRESWTVAEPCEKES